MEGDSGVESVDLTRIDPDLALAIGTLLARVWPKPEKDASHRAGQLIAIGKEYRGLASQAPHTFFVRDGDEVIAASTMAPRAIRIGEGSDAVEMTVMGLAMVGSSPERRGEGLGAKVVEAAFGMIDDGVASYSLFQTSHAVRPFYEGVGGCLVDNRVVNSLGEDPSANPFWDDVVMRYPAGGDWPAGVIDLLGPGY